MKYKITIAILTLALPGPLFAEHLDVVHGISCRSSGSADLNYSSYGIYNNDYWGDPEQMLCSIPVTANIGETIDVKAVVDDRDNHQVYIPQPWPGGTIHKTQAQVACISYLFDVKGILRETSAWAETGNTNGRQTLKMSLPSQGDDVGSTVVVKCYLHSKGGRKNVKGGRLRRISLG